MSWIVWGGEKALKPKGPLRYPFRDFSAAQARERNSRK
jgi:aminoglycoside phosphotransferase family enzyme